MQTDKVALRQKLAEPDRLGAQRLERGARPAARDRAAASGSLGRAPPRQSRSGPARSGRASAPRRRPRAGTTAPSPGTARTASPDRPRRHGGLPPKATPRSSRPSPPSVHPAYSSSGSPTGSPPPRRCCRSRPPCWRIAERPVSRPVRSRSMVSVSKQTTASQPAAAADNSSRERIRSSGLTVTVSAPWRNRLGPGSGIG